MKMRFLLFICFIFSILIATEHAEYSKELQPSVQQAAGPTNNEQLVGATMQDMHMAMKRSALEEQSLASQTASEKKLDRRSLGSYNIMPASQANSNFMNYWKYHNDDAKTLELNKDMNQGQPNMYDGTLTSLNQDFKHVPDSSYLDAIFEKSPYTAMKADAHYNSVPESYDKQADYRAYMGLPQEFDYGNQNNINSLGTPSYEKNMQSRSYEMNRYGLRGPLTAEEQRENMENMGNYANAAEAERDIKRRSAQAVNSANYEENNLSDYEKAVNRRDLKSAPYNNNAYYVKNNSNMKLDSNAKNIETRSKSTAADTTAATYDQQGKRNAQQNYAKLLAYAKEMNRRSNEGNSFYNKQKSLQRSYGNTVSNTAKQASKEVDRRSYDPNFYLKMEPFGKDTQHDPLHPSTAQKDIGRRAAVNSYDNVESQLNTKGNKDLQRRYALANSNAYLQHDPLEMTAAVNCGEKQEGQCGGGPGGGKVEVGKGDARQKSSNIAMKAAVDAKAAQDAQLPAGEAAAAQVRQQLAERAMAAAQAAEAALAGKQQIVQQLEQEVRESEAVTREQEASLLSAQSNVDASKQAAQDAEQQLATLKHAVVTAKAHVADAEAAASGAQQSLAEKGQLLEAAKNRVEVLLRQLSAARQDYEKTKTAAYKAVCAAAEAKSRANRMRRMLRRRHERYLRELVHIAEKPQPLDQAHQQEQQHEEKKSDT